MTSMLPQQSAYQRAASRYSGDGISTASPQRLLVLLYDRLALDLVRAHQAQLEGDRETSHDNLTHAQEIIAELMSSLDVEAWDGGARLRSLYAWLMAELGRANIRMEPKRVLDCLEVVEPLRAAWTETAAGAAAPQGIPVGLSG